jgi:predicted RNA-binding protein with PUA-like domain
MTTSHWLVKSEPNTYSFADLERDGRTVWDGVRNNAAALHLKAMAESDEVLF